MATLSFQEEKLSFSDASEQEMGKHLAKIYDPKVAEAMGWVLRRVEKARLQRDAPNHYFDDMTYVADYRSNENAKNAYLRKKRNDSEVRVVTGVTEKKIEAVYNELLSLNLQHEVLAFDQDDNELVDLGHDFGDLVTRTNRVEEDDDFWQEAVLELLTQRAVFIEEQAFDYLPRRGGTPKQIIRKELISGLKVYLGDISIPAHRFNEQPYIVKYDRVHWKIAEAEYGRNPNWKYVQKGAPKTSNLGDVFSYRMGTLMQDEVEILTYCSLPDNELLHIVSGVFMEEPGSKESEIPWESEEYRMKMFVLKSMSSECAYGKPLTASAKTLQALEDETIRLMIRKFQQALEPPLAVPKGKNVFSKDIWDPGAVAYGLKKDDFERLISHDGVTQGEFAMFNLIEQKIEEFIGSSNIRQGLPSREAQTATEVLEIQKQAAKQLGLATAALVRMKREMTKARIFTILEEMLDPVKKRMNPFTRQVEKVYRSFTISGVMLGNEKKGTKFIQFRDRDLEPEEMQMMFNEEERQAKLGRNIRFSSINVNTLRAIPYTWYVVVNPSQREGSALDKIMFQDSMAQGVTVSQIAQRPMNGDKLIDDFERIWKRKDWFQRAAPQALMGGQMPLEEKEQGEMQDVMAEMDELGKTPVDSQMRNGIRGGQTQRPSLSALLQPANV